jgi:predicted RNA-binding protein with PUA-like domain
MAAKKRPAVGAAKRKAPPRSATPRAKAPAQAARKAAAKPGTPAAKPSTAPGPRKPGERRYWLLKTEPQSFSFEDLESRPGRTAAWDGVRSYEARNTMRDAMKVGDGVLIYHSNAAPPHVAGLAEIVGEAHVDETQFDPKDDHFDPKARRESPTWVCVDVRAVRKLRPVPLPELRQTKGLEGMVLLRKGSRLSVQPVSAEEWRILTALGGA